MISYTTTARGARRARPDRRTRFARRMVFEEFGYRYARALDYNEFVDRRPGALPKPAPGGWGFAK